MSESLLWEKAPHTEMKHEILRRYLAAWVPIISKWNRRLIIIDGFAGPGEYARGEPGSPKIIIDTIINHTLRERFPEIILLFIEKDIDRAEYLEGLLCRSYPLNEIGKNAYELTGSTVKIQIVKGEFAKTLATILDSLQEKNAQMAPCFAFIDPFGISGMPMDLIIRFMKHPKSEVFINFAFDTVNRRIKVPEFEKIFDELFGCSDWRKFRSTVNTEDRHKGLLMLYIKQLKQVAGATYVLPFMMRDNKNRELYHLIFATKNPKGLDEMKITMWKIDPTGNFQFSDYTYNPGQLSLFPPEPDYEELAKLIWDHFKSKLVRPEDIKEWVITQTQRYASNHVNSALQILEGGGKIKKYEAVFDPRQGWVKGKPYERRGAFPERKILIDFTGS
jgi:three-Cys-motif partner protein